MSSNTWKVTVTDVDEKGDECFVEISLDEDFMEKFKQANGMKRWNDKRFSAWFVNILKKAVDTIDRKDKFETLYNRSSKEGSLDHVVPGDLIEYENKNGATHFREIGEIVEDRRCKGGKKFKTVPMLEGDHVIAKEESVSFENVLRVLRNKS